jgi:hypothetical protein
MKTGMPSGLKSSYDEQKLLISIRKIHVRSGITSGTMPYGYDKYGTNGSGRIIVLPS